MAIIVEERFGSRRTVGGENESKEILYEIIGTDSDADAETALAAEVPALWGGLVYKNHELEQEGPELWFASVRYGPYQEEEEKETGESTYQFDTGGGQAQITQSLETVDSYPAPGEPAAPDFGGAIGVTLDSVEGVSITVPVFNFSETHYVDDSSVTTAYKAALFAATGKVNNAAFKNFSKGEVLFLGASGSKRGTEDWEITFKFAASPNVTGLTVGPIAGIDKEGWHYLWVRYAKEDDAAAKRMIKKPIAAYVERVYEYGDMTTLGIGS